MLKKICKILVFLIVLFFVLSCTVVRHEEKGEKKDGVTFYFENEDFDAASYVQKNWDSRIVPEIKDSAVPLGNLIHLLQEDQDSAISEYGVRKEETSPYAFIVSGEYPVKELNRDSAAGYLYIEQDDLSDNGFCAIQIGPVFKLSAVRDALSFINFGDFANQIEFANISREINFYIRDNITENLGDTLPDNSIVSFYGVFIMDKNGKVIITPVTLIVTSGE